MGGVALAGGVAVVLAVAERTMLYRAPISLASISKEGLE